MFFRLPQPLPAENKDPKEIVRGLSKYKVIPYFGNDVESAHIYMSRVAALTEISPTFNAVLSDRKEYTFGNNPIITARNIPGLGNEVEEVPFEQQRNFVFWLRDLGVGMRNVSALSRRIDHHLEQSGNAYLRIRRVSEGEAVKYFFDVPHFLHCAYVESEDPGERFIINTPFMLRPEKFAEFPPEIHRASQMGEPLRFAQITENTESTILHIKINASEDSGVYYGRPANLPHKHWLYVDYQLSSLSGKVSATELISKKLLAFEAPDPARTIPTTKEDPAMSALDVSEGRIGVVKKAKTRFQKSMLVLKELVTNIATHPTENSAAAAAFAGIEYPHGTKPPTPIDLEMNRDTKHQDWQLGRACAFICACLGWAPELLALRQAKSNLGGNMLYDIFVLVNTTTVVPRQVFFQDVWNSIIAEIAARESGGSAFDGLGIKFPETIGELIEQLRPAATNPANVTGITDETNPANNITEDETDNLNP